MYLLSYKYLHKIAYNHVYTNAQPCIRINTASHHHLYTIICIIMYLLSYKYLHKIAYNHVYTNAQLPHNHYTPLHTDARRHIHSMIRTYTHKEQSGRNKPGSTLHENKTSYNKKKYIHTKKNHATHRTDQVSRAEETRDFQLQRQSTHPTLPKANIPSLWKAQESLKQRADTQIMTLPLAVSPTESRRPTPLLLMRAKQTSPRRIFCSRRNHRLASSPST
jgi:hypothetical protein